MSLTSVLKWGAFMIQLKTYSAVLMGTGQELNKVIRNEVNGRLCRLFSRVVVMYLQ